MKVAVIGAGGVGGYFGGRLAQAGIDTTFIARGATLEALRTRGLRVESTLGDFHLEKVKATNDPAEAGPVDVVLMAVKAWQIPEASRGIASMLRPDSVIVPLENGIDAPEVLTKIAGAEHVAGGLCAIVSFIVEPGHIRHPAYEPTVMFGELDNRPSERLARLREAFLSAGVKAEIPADIHHSMWTKFLFISTMSGIGALTRVPLGAWRSDPDIRAMADAMLREVVALAKVRRAGLTDEDVTRTWERYDAMVPESTASMQRDIVAGKPSELDGQLGAIVRLGAESGVATPVTSFVYHALLPQERLARQNAAVK